MKVRSRSWSPSDARWSTALDADDAAAQLILSFGPVDAPDASWFAAIAAHCPNAQHVYTSGGGQIVDGLVQDTPTVTAFLTFEGDTTVHPYVLDGVRIDNSADLGAQLGAQLAAVSDLRHVLIFAEGITFNAAAFLETLNAQLPSSVKISGGLASNGIALSQSVVGLNGVPTEKRLVAVGLAGSSIEVGTGSVGGWELFGPERVVTAADIAAVHTLDGERALDVYKRYLGDFARELPGSALLFPLAVRTTPNAPLAVRTILGIDEATGTLRFAGDIPVGSRVRLMRTNSDKLLDGAAQAASIARTSGSDGESLALCISFIGRRAVLRTRVDEEIDEVARESGSAVVVGFYSNGEIAPPSDGREFAQAVLHNQTMTVTTIRER
jgi:hypothetical protein